ncbi:MAG TPA: hypothetical protein VIN59_03905 [Alphaproteobacteria bacterium]
MRYLLLVVLIFVAMPAFAQHAILYRDWKNCVSLMVQEQLDRGSMVPMVMMLNNAFLSCEPEGDLFAEDLQARNHDMTVKARVDYINQIRQKIRNEVAEDHAE